MFLSDIRILLVYLAVLGGTINGQEQNYESWVKASNGFLYKVFDDELSWPDSESKCREHNAELASKGLRDPVVKSEILESTKNISLVWIGLRAKRGKTTGKRKWVWSDYVLSDEKQISWNVNEPNNVRRDEDCVMMNTAGKLLDHTCTFCFKLVCEVNFNTIGEEILKITKEPANKTNLISVATNIDLLLQGSVDFFAANSKMSEDIVNSVDRFLISYDAAKEGNFTRRDGNVAINVTRLSDSETHVIGGLGDADSLARVELKLTPDILAEALSRQSNGELVQVASILYKKIRLFQIDHKNYNSNQTESNQTIPTKSIWTPIFGEDPKVQLMPIPLSEVVSVNIRNVTTEKFVHPVRFSLKTGNRSDASSTAPKRIGDLKAIQSSKCAFWNVNENDWSTRGCVTSERKETDGETSIVCECDHMTAFAVVLNTTYIFAPKYMDDITKAFCSLSIVCLIITVVTILSSSKLREQSPQQIVLNICVNLIALNVIFVVGIDRADGNQNEVKGQGFCMATSVALHYFLLTSWAWMLVEAVFLFLAVAVPAYTDGVRGKIVLYAFGLAYGIPALVSGLVAGLSEKYLSERYCWLHPDLLKYAVFVPVGLILGINMIVFLQVPCFIMGRNKFSQDSRTACCCCARGCCSPVCCSTVFRTMQRTVGIMFILGIPWIFGFLMLLVQDGEMKYQFAMCFTVFNTCQGILIFVVFCAMQKNVRDVWKRGYERWCKGPFRRLVSERRHRKERRAVASSDNSSATIKLTTLDTARPSEPATTPEKLPFRHGWVN